LNKDREYVLEILEGLLRNESRYGYRSCPCRLAAGIREKDADIICPCAYRNPDLEEYGSCYCRLYVSTEWNEEKIDHGKVPERRRVA
jgi:ferredoxin-thioredoxin reductase catalytic chain